MCDDGVNDDTWRDVVLEIILPVIATFVIIVIIYRIKKNKYNHRTSVVAGTYAASPPQLNHEMSRQSNPSDTIVSHVIHISPSAPVESMAPSVDNHVITLSTI